MSKDVHSALDQAYELTWHDQQLLLLSQRAVWLPKHSTLLVADLHLGKETAFRAASIPVPDVTAIDLRRLSMLIEKTKCSQLVILGDLVHSAQGLSRDVIEQTARWRETHRDVHMQLIVGNHDAKAGPLPKSWDLDCQNISACGPFQLRHIPPETSSPPCLAGHLHPKYRLRTATDWVTLPCFVLTGEVLILPAFGTFVDGQAVKMSPARYFVISDQTVLELRNPRSKLSRMAR